jgi:hypothetical protein
VGLRATAVVRLVGALAHVRTPFSYNVQGASLPDATLAERGGATARPYAGVMRRSIIPARGAPMTILDRHRWRSFCAAGESSGRVEPLPVGRRLKPWPHRC